MRAISKIDSDLRIYQNKKVILWGAGRLGRKFIQLFKYFSVEISSFCDADPEKRGSTYCGYPVISPEDLDLDIEKDKVLVQMAIENPKDENENIERLKKYGITDYIGMKEGYEVLHQMKKIALMQQNKVIHTQQQQVEQAYIVALRQHLQFDFLLDAINQEDYLDCVLLCSMQKTGTSTLDIELPKLGVPIYRYHEAKQFNHSMIQASGKKVKYITGVREPISRELSYVFQVISGMSSNYVGWDRDFCELEQPLFLDGGNAQVFFDTFQKSTRRECSLVDESGEIVKEMSKSERFFHDYCETIVDVYKHPFDQEKGYTIIKEGNVEVFFYQLEKLNDLLPELSAFLGVAISGFGREDANIAADKWVAESYKESKKTLRFSQEYFDNCFAEPWVSHCYSAEDIERFKNKWQGNIHPEG